METETKLALALAMTEAAVRDMAEAGLSHQEIAIGLAFYVNEQAGLAMPTPEAATQFKQSLTR